VRAYFPEATIGLVETANPGGARNFLLNEATGDLLLFLDDDVTFPPNLLAKLHQLAEENPSVAVFGGPNLTPPKSSMFQLVQGAVLGSVLATGPVRRRYGRHPAGSADERFFTLCNMAVRRKNMLSFPPELICAEENAVLYELAVELAKMHYDPELFVYHERRDTFRGFVRQMEKYGTGRGQVIARRPASCQPLHLAAAAQPLWLASLPVVAIVWSPWYLVTGVVYLTAVLASGAKVAWSMKRMPVTRRAVVGLLGAALTTTVHTCYGIGVIHGMIRRPRPPRSEWKPLSGPALDGPRLVAKDLS
jgi:glycosyltransferase involved in cell wall biosynthesis